MAVKLNNESLICSKVQERLHGREHDVSSTPQIQLQGKMGVKFVNLNFVKVISVEIFRAKGKPRTSESKCKYQMVTQKYSKRN